MIGTMVGQFFFFKLFFYFINLPFIIIPHFLNHIAIFDLNFFRGRTKVVVDEILLSYIVSYMMVS